MDLVVLVVDEEPEIALQLSTVLKNEGWNVIEASSGTEAFSKIKTERPWLLILGENLPDMPGRQLLEKVADYMSETASGGIRPDLIMIRQRGAASEEFGMYTAFPRAQKMIESFFNRPFEPLELIKTVARLHAEVEAHGSMKRIDSRFRKVPIKDVIAIQ